MSFFDNGNLEEFLFLMRNFSMTSTASGTLETGAKVQYMGPLVRGEALRQFDLLSADVESVNPLTVENIINGLALYFLHVNLMLGKKFVMRRGMSKPRSLKVRRCAARLIDSKK